MEGWSGTASPATTTVVESGPPIVAKVLAVELEAAAPVVPSLPAACAVVVAVVETEVRISVAADPAELLVAVTQAPRRACADAPLVAAAAAAARRVELAAVADVVAELTVALRFGATAVLEVAADSIAVES